MPGANISEVKVVIHDEVRGREEYNPPMKKAEVTIVALVAENEDGAVALEYISGLAAAKVKAILLGTTAAAVVAPAADKPATAGKRQAKAADAPAAEKVEAPAAEEKVADAGESSPNTSAGSPDLELGKAEEDEWTTTADVKPVTDADLLAATSAAAGRLGSKDPVKDLIAKYNTKPEGQPFKVQEIPAELRADYITKLAAL